MMTDNDIIKALECCSSSTGAEACNGCPFNEKDICDTEDDAPQKYALALINRQKAEIEDLKADVIIAKRYEKDARELFKDATAEIDRLRGALSPCDLCRYNPPSSMGGKPCSLCPATKKEEV